MLFPVPFCEFVNIIRYKRIYRFFFGGNGFPPFLLAAFFAGDGLPLFSCFFFAGRAGICAGPGIIPGIVGIIWINPRFFYLHVLWRKTYARKLHSSSAGIHFFLFPATVPVRRPPSFLEFSEREMTLVFALGSSFDLGSTWSTTSSVARLRPNLFSASTLWTYLSLFFPFVILRYLPPADIVVPGGVSNFFLAGIDMPPSSL